MNDAFVAAQKGRCDLSKWLSASLLLPPEPVVLNIAAELGGRYALRVYMPMFRLYGAELEFFKLGFIAWILSSRTTTDSLCQKIQCEPGGGEFPAIVFCGYVAAREGRLQAHAKVQAEPRLFLPSRPPLKGYATNRFDAPSFGVFDRDHFGYMDELQMSEPPRKAMVITASRVGLRVFARWMMLFAVRGGEELTLSHGGIRSQIGTFSYEAKFCKHEVLR